MRKPLASPRQRSEGKVSPSRMAAEAPLRSVPADPVGQFAAVDLDAALGEHLDGGDPGRSRADDADPEAI
ncbi:hypothetical protein F9C11_32530 [Amycolatopsis sp. VS8301801F10]|uniref:hypothetical protein n=1 Tax=Amycolatopsis sp. VS8301801F10 TaxID=2652442 RepID=UPI0038FC6A88